jgi:hypothetical protein
MFDPFDDDDAPVGAIPGLRVALRIRGSALDADFVTQQMGVAPTVDTDDASDDPAGVWQLALSLPAGTELGDGIDMLLARVPNDATLWEELGDAYTIDVHCTLDMQDGPPHQRTSIDASVLERLTHLRLPLTFAFDV